jgi:hypothetical protein
MVGNPANRHSLTVLLLAFLFYSASCAPGPYLVYSPRDSSFAPVPTSFTPPSETITSGLPAVPETWEVVDAAVADVTGDGQPEWVLAVRRPWRDWPIVTWHGGESPIAEFRDREGKSSHLVLLTPAGDEIWAGSALPLPIRALAAGDIDGDGTAEVVTLEGEYADNPRRPARRIDVWRWDCFGFVLIHRSGQARLRELYLYHQDSDGILDIIIR